MSAPGGSLVTEMTRALGSSLATSLGTDLPPVGTATYSSTLDRRKKYQPAASAAATTTRMPMTIGALLGAFGAAGRDFSDEIVRGVETLSVCSTAGAARATGAFA